MMRVAIKPELFRWARIRADMQPDSLAQRFPKYREWESGDVQPTLKQLEAFAKKTHAPIGYFFLSEPPNEPFPIPDFRTIGSSPIGRPNPDLLDTIYLCQQRQEWYRDFSRIEGEEPLPFVGSARLAEDVEVAAARIRNALEFDLKERATLGNWVDALRRFISLADALGVLVMVNGVVGNNTHRKLDPHEFRGFALVDDLAPLVFINGADTKAAQMFTLAHELVHIWLGQTALSDSHPTSVPSHETESWCNRVAAELLVPLGVLREEYRRGEEISAALARLARQFKVSTLVILRRIYDIGGLSRDQLNQAYADELKRLKNIPRGSGGNFYATQGVRVGDRFARAVVTSTLEGQTLYRDAFRLLGFSKLETFHKFADGLDVN
ncbi:MAG: ImmA/IrrE family metallo-endopeptidase [Nitrospinae bacterium]|nr:ImmA/IrrE family metallo-endopeptidase [Nitrospinota bacterium]